MRRWAWPLTLLLLLQHPIHSRLVAPNGSNPERMTPSQSRFGNNMFYERIDQSRSRRLQDDREILLNEDSPAISHAASRFLPGRSDSAARRARFIEKAAVLYAAVSATVPPVPPAVFTRRNRAAARHMRNVQSVYYYGVKKGEQLQLSRASGRFSKAHAFPTRSVPDAPQSDSPLPPTSFQYDPKRHNKDKLLEDSLLLADAIDLARSLSRTTMRVKTFPEIDDKLTTPLPLIQMNASTTTKAPKKSTTRARKSHITQAQPTQQPLSQLPVFPQPQTPTAFLLSSPAVLAPPLPPPGLPTPALAAQSALASPLLRPSFVNSQAPNASLEQLGCGFDLISNTCKDVFGIGWCGQCYDFGNIFLHDCKCVQPLINSAAIAAIAAQAAAVANGQPRI